MRESLEQVNDKLPDSRCLRCDEIAVAGATVRVDYYGLQT